ncbi:MAG: hypothetical protein HND54_09395 [Bacteroidetes bacterium]|nr:hypothetical protein [Bacteroidota bacterium]MCB0802642.1 hypothetical protein [Flavobacteriales bacterium]NOG57934.1 hypothetical protein [Bacteroidota bacterium]
MESVKLNWFDKQADQFEKDRFGLMAMMIAIQSCWGSVAAGLSYNSDSMLWLSLCATFTMMNNAVLIAQGPPKYCVGIFWAATVVNTAVVILQLFVL